MIDNSRSGGDEDDKKIEEDVPVYVVEVASVVEFNAMKRQRRGK